ncbi:succinate dehydrogenase assembly factor 2 [Asticcacaulis sp. AND118]|uniref:FAD assembly factor SdhE n=1 Tax=Asticcacaulis sp. AND118 TaxID=2840468 RepID=UPI001CFFB83C|nr:succinate dehydrogenase assembly factor 2 [Asticcacaulis sp. AND118]UDF02366.1 succinate dehydrogenase assembly factor 2 [Asticcacaulis sp. AND118]
MTDTVDDLHQARLRKLWFRASRRGFKEADIILSHFAEEYLPTLTPQQLDIFEDLLEAPDQDLYGWIIERDPVPAERQSEIMNMLNQYYKTAYTKLQK